jgi:hypothetical protein
MLAGAGTCRRGESRRHTVGLAVHRGDHAIRQRRSLFEFFLCLSRACLGKMIVFISKIAQKDGVFLPDIADSRGARVRVGPVALQQAGVHVQRLVCLRKAILLLTTVPRWVLVKTHRWSVDSVTGEIFSAELRSAFL